MAIKSLPYSLTSRISGNVCNIFFCQASASLLTFYTPSSTSTSVRYYSHAVFASLSSAHIYFTNGHKMDYLFSYTSFLIFFFLFTATNPCPNYYAAENAPAYSLSGSLVLAYSDNYAAYNTNTFRPTRCTDGDTRTQPVAKRYKYF